MKINIYRVEGKKVNCLSKYGELYGNWGSQNEPQEGQYYVELDCEEVLTNDAISFEENKGYYTKLQSNHVELHGRIEAIEENMMYFRFGENIIMFETKGIDTIKYLNSFVKIKIKELVFIDLEL